MTELARLGRAALTKFGIEPRVLRLLRHQHNTTFRVESDVGRFALRINRPGVHGAETIESEMTWLRALRVDTDLCVPEPVPALDGSHVARTESEVGTHGNRRRLGDVPGLMRRLLPLLLFLMALFSVSSSAYACSCMEPDAGQLLASSPAAFVGTVVGITPAGTDRSMTFDVETVFAGEIPEEFSVLAGTADGASCGLGANVGSRLAIFTHQDDTGVLHASSCGAMDADTALRALGTGYPPAGEAAPPAPMDWQLVWLAVGALGLVGGAWLVMRRSA